VAAGLSKVTDDHQTGALIEGEHGRWAPSARLRVTGRLHEAGGTEHAQALCNRRARNAELISKFVARCGLA
jgi:hypothetical protein